MIIKHLFYRFLFLVICYIPLGMLMFIGKPERLQGLLFDIENFYGLKPFVLTIFIGGCCLIGLETLRLFVKKKKTKYLSNFFLLLFFSTLSVYSIQNNIFYKEVKAIPTQVKHTTLLVATEGSIYNFDLEANKIAWEYNSRLDYEGNRNFFVLNEQNIFMPFESGSFINFDVNTGKIIWKKQIYGRKEVGIIIEAVNTTDHIINVEGLTPLFMSKPLVDEQQIVIASHGQPSRTNPYLYSFDKKTGQTNWQESLPTHFNVFAPIKYKGSKFDYYFVNSAVFLEKYGSNSGSRTSYGMFDDNQFDWPIYNQMQTDGKNIFIGDEKGKIYCLPLDENANIPNGSYSPNNTFIKNPSVFKWIFSDESFTFQENSITFLDNGILYTDIKNSTDNQSAIFAIKTNNGKLKWKKTVKGSILNWTLINDEIIGNTQNTIFSLDVTGENYTEINIPTKPLSNIELLDKGHFIYITQKGIEVFNVNTKKFTVVFDKQFNDNSHNNLQIKLISK